MYVYILYSASLGRYYTGLSRFRQKRLRQHLKGQTSWTSRADDWIEVWFTVDGVNDFGAGPASEIHTGKRMRSPGKGKA